MAESSRPDATRSAHSSAVHLSYNRRAPKPWIWISPSFLHWPQA